MDDVVKHSIKRVFGGSDESGWIRLDCSCGWSSRKCYAYEDYQRTILHNLEREHRTETKPCCDNSTSQDQCDQCQEVGLANPLNH